MKKSLLLFIFLNVSVIEAQALLISRVWEKSDKCPIETPFYERYYKQCVGCDYTDSMSFQKNLEDFEKCKNRVIEQTYKSENHNEYVSFLIECPEEYPLRDYWGGCHSCAETEAVMVKSDENCHVCSNRKIQPLSDYMNRCVLKGCPSVAPLFNGQDCLPCYTYQFEFSESDCQKCNGTEFERDYIDGKTKVGKFTGSEKGCYLREIGQFYQIRLNGPDTGIWISVEPNPRQNSYSCNEERPIMTLPSVCKRCPNRSYNIETGECVFDRKLTDDVPIFYD